MQGAFNLQPSAPMIIRSPIHYNNENTLIVANGMKVMMIDKGKLCQKIGDIVKEGDTVKFVQLP